MDRSGGQPRRQVPFGGTRVGGQWGPFPRQPKLARNPQPRRPALLSCRDSSQGDGLILTLRSHSAHTPPADELQAAVTDVVRPLVAKQADASITVAAVTPRARAVLAFGLGSNWPAPAGDLIYEIGSVTKVFTSSLLADLVRKGEVSLDDPVRRYLPPNVRVPSYGEADITLEHLATHTSGLPRLPKNLKLTRATRLNPYATYSVDDLYEFLSRHRSGECDGYRLRASHPGENLHTFRYVRHGSDIERGAGTTPCPRPYSQRQPDAAVGSANTSRCRGSPLNSS